MRPFRFSLRLKFPSLSRFRVRTKPDARIVHAFRPDARRAIGPAANARRTTHGDRERPFGRRTLAVCLAVVFVAGVATAWVGSRGFRDVARSRDELKAMEARIHAEQAVVAELRRDVERLKKDRLAVERIARESLGYVRPGEITLLLPKEPAAIGGRAVPPATPPD